MTPPPPPPAPLILVLILLTLTQAADHCKEGQVRDLDGSCVTKFVLPKPKSSCPPLVIDNGNSFLRGRIAEFFCDTGYVMVPDTDRAICQVMTGLWSKLVPVCLMPGCQAPPVPPSGSLSLSHSSSLAQFSCEEGHSLVGHTTLACIDGTKWNGTSPSCQRMTTPPPSLSSPTASCSSPLLPSLLLLIAVASQ